jgi:dihydrofolate synthase/folylpolyglutamate synthase
LAEVLEECERVNAGAPITFFEATTAAAFLAFARHPADIALVESGLGSQYDATNVIARPLATIFTPISLDHQNFLGPTVAAIAASKAGILKRGVPAVVAPQPPEALAMIAAHAATLAVPLFRHGQEWQMVPRAEGGFDYRGRRWTLALPPPALLGRHQLDNAATAIACLDRLDGIAVTPDHLRHGLTTAEWPARLQRLTAGPLAVRLPAATELWLDGGHNEGGARALAEVARGWRGRKLRLVFGMIETHDPESFLRPLAPLIEGLEAVTIPGTPASRGAAELAATAETLGIRARAQPDLPTAVAAAGAAAPGSRVLICGSLYLAGQVLALPG